MIPAAVITALRGQWLYFWGGWLTGGILWFIGTVARGPDAPPRDPRWVLVALGVVTAMFALGLLGARPSPLLGLDGRALQSSVGNKVPYLPEPDPCERQADGSWMCTRWDAGFSGTVGYEVRADRLGCWEAERATFSGEGSPKELSGCVSLVDFVFG